MPRRQPLLRAADRRRRDVVWSYCGVRPLYDDGSADPSAVTRDYVLRRRRDRRRGAGALGVRRQDHHLPPARRARARRSSRRGFPACGRRGPRAAPCPARRFRDGDSARSSRERLQARYAAAAATRCCTELARRHGALAVRSARAMRAAWRDLGDALRRRALRARGRLPRRARMGARPRKTCCGGAPRPACTSTPTRSSADGAAVSVRYLRTGAVSLMFVR